jgi:ABC-2 type transport system permease protein
MPVVFFLTPLSMLGGSFFTMKMLPVWLHWLLWANPFFYFINGIRGAMIGVDEAPPGLSIGLTLLMIAVLGGLVWRLFSQGYGLRE